MKFMLLSLCYNHLLNTAIPKYGGVQTINTMYVLRVLSMQEISWGLPPWTRWTSEDNFQHVEVPLSTRSYLGAIKPSKKRVAKDYTFYIIMIY